MTTHFPLILCATLFAGSLRAQLDFLTLRESESLMDLVPDVVTAQKKGGCPILSPTYDGPEELAFQVRSTCGPGSGMLIGNYLVNRRTGLVTTSGDKPTSVADAKGVSLAEQLVRAARKRILSAEEAQCLALQAARSLPGWGGTDAVISVKPFGKVDGFDSTMRFTATRVSSTRPVESGRMLTVELATARVRDDEVGQQVISASVGDLSSKLLELRTPLWLNDEEAASVALLVPRVAAHLGPGCKLYAGGAFYARDAVMGVSCNGSNIRDSNVLVSLQTGEVKDPDTGESLESIEAVRRTRDFLLNLQKRRAGLQKEVESACRP